MEMDKLVQLLESPIFMSLRLQLLEPQRHPYLFKALYGLLMLLPQSSAFETLRNRLDSVASVTVLQSIPGVRSAPVSVDANIDFSELLEHFRIIRRKHQQFLINQRLAEDKKAIKAAIEDAGFALSKMSPRSESSLSLGATAENHV
jgi:vacuole morphology and inheritance protein 14